ncbi:MAG: amidohydrolase family protein [Acidobacteria bacterium]|nr:amidohydrolase family protein [Acidobacteriota bacterium]
MRRSVIYTAVLIAAWAVTLVRAQNGLPPEVAEHGYADLVVVNGKIVSMDDAGLNTNPGRIHEAMAIKGDRIMALGTNSRIRTLANARTQVIDLGGQTVIPGIVESHAHLYGNTVLGQQLGLRSPDKGINVTVQAGKDVETTRMKIEDAIKDAVTKVQPGDWIVVGLAPNNEEGANFRVLTEWTIAEDLEPRQRLDRVAADNPVMVASGVRGNLNSKAWELVEKHMPTYTKFVTQSMGKEYADSPEKGLVGSQEMAAITWEIWYKDQPLSLAAEMVRRNLEMGASHGITTFSSRVPMPRVLDAFTMLNRENQQPIRFAALYEIHRMPNDPQVTRNLYRMTGNLTGLGNDHLWIHGVASERWDSIFPMGCLGKDVEAPPKIKAREICPSPGEIWWDTLQNAMEAGWRLAGIHGVGSDGIRRFLQLIAQVQKNTGMSDEDIRKLRPTVEHASVIGTVPDVVEGLKKYGVYVSAGTIFFMEAPEYMRDYGPAVEPFLLPLKTLLDKGVKVVGQNEVYTGIGYLWTLFMTREVYGKTYLPQEALDRVTVLKMWTKWPSEYVMRENDLGSLEAGKLADFVILDRDYFTIPVQQIPKIRPQMTVVGGKTVFLDSGFAAKLGKQPVGYQFPPGYEPWALEALPGMFR